MERGAGKILTNGSDVAAGVEHTLYMVSVVWRKDVFENKRSVLIEWAELYVGLRSMAICVGVVQ